MKKIISVFLILTLLIMPFGLKGIAFNEDKKIKIACVTTLNSQNGEEEAVIDEDGERIEEYEFSPDAKEIVVSSNLSQYPSYYDAREQGIITEVKNQYKSGCCWAFGAISAAETSLIKKGLSSSEETDLSEAHLTWFALNSITENKNDLTFGDGISAEDPFYIGGNWTRSVFTLARWSGADTEEKAPFYEDISLMGNYPENNRYNSVAHLQNSEYIQPSDRESIKKVIIEGGSVTACYYSSTTFYQSGDYGTSYYQRNVSNTNHTITIVGWDDDFSKDNFKRTPTDNGAWLVKNSWGSEWGDDGYFWLSYYDKSLSYIVSFDMESSDNYDNINQYDGFGYKGWAYFEEDRTMSMANVFTAKKAEEVKAVSFYTVQSDIEYTVSIYKDIPKYGSPTDGIKAGEAKGFLKHRGYYTVNLDSSVFVRPGEKYSAVVTVTAPEGYYACVPLEYPEGFDGGNSRSYYGETGQSYYTIGTDFDDWTDSAAQGYNNVCVKTFSDDAEFFEIKDGSDYVISQGKYILTDTPGRDLTSQFKTSGIYQQSGKIILYSDEGREAYSIEIILRGDVNKNGKVDFADAKEIYNYMAGKKVLDGGGFLAADMNKDGKLGLYDLLAVWYNAVIAKFMNFQEVRL